MHNGGGGGGDDEGWRGTPPQRNYEVPLQNAFVHAPENQKKKTKGERRRYQKVSRLELSHVAITRHAETFYDFIPVAFLMSLPLFASTYKGKATSSLPFRFI